VFRPTDIALIAVMVSAAAFTYKTKQEAGRELSALRQIESQIRFEQDSIDLLKADWSLLTQPARLQRLTEVYDAELQLKPVEPTQYATVAELPARPLDIRDIIGSSGELLAEFGETDDTLTGSIGQ
jgi:hypothetical protein